MAGPSSCQQATAQLYNGVIRDVVNNVREAFLDEGCDESVLTELKQLWESKVLASGQVDLFGLGEAGAAATSSSKRVRAEVAEKSIPQVQKQPQRQYPGGPAVNIPLVKPVVAAAGTTLTNAALAANLALPQVALTAAQGQAPRVIASGGGVIHFGGHATPVHFVNVLPNADMQTERKANSNSTGGRGGVTARFALKQEPSKQEESSPADGDLVQVDGPGGSSQIVPELEPQPGTSKADLEANRALRKRHKGAKRKKPVEVVIQVDGPAGGGRGGGSAAGGRGGGVSDSDVSDDLEGVSDDEADDLEDVDGTDAAAKGEAGEEPQEEGEPLNSDDDASDDEDAEAMFNADNVVVCQYDKIRGLLSGTLVDVQYLPFFLGMFGHNLGNDRWYREASAGISHQPITVEPIVPPLSICSPPRPILKSSSNKTPAGFLADEQSIPPLDRTDLDINQVEKENNPPVQNYRPLSDRVKELAKPKQQKNFLTTKPPLAPTCGARVANLQPAQRERGGAAPGKTQSGAKKGGEAQIRVGNRPATTPSAPAAKEMEELKEQILNQSKELESMKDALKTRDSQIENLVKLVEQLVAGNARSGTENHTNEETKHGKQPPETPSPSTSETTTKMVQSADASTGVGKSLLAGSEAKNRQRSKKTSTTSPAVGAGAKNRKHTVAEKLKHKMEDEQKTGQETGKEITTTKLINQSKIDIDPKAVAEIDLEYSSSRDAS